MTARRVRKGAKRAENRLFFVVDRDVHLRRLLSDFLDPIGFAVKFFDDGYAALDAVRRTPPRLVVTDLLVPKLDGLALCRLIKNDEKLRQVKVMVLSAIAVDERARTSGADAVLGKPIERERIVAAVRRLTGSPEPEADA